jgi:RND family efflux transporter MFP subunit
MRILPIRMGRRTWGYGCLTIIALLLWTWRSTSVSAPPQNNASAQEPTSPADIIVMGRTQCIGTRKSTIAPVPLHPVTEILVHPGSRVKKGQRLVKLDDDEPQADVRAKQAALESAGLTLEECRRHFAAAEKNPSVLPQKLFYDIRLAAQKAERDERAAKAALDSAKAELEHYEVTAQIDGVVSWLNVHLGMVSRPGTTVWGEILDLRELDIRCDLTLAQVERVSVGQSADVRKKSHHDLFGTGQVVFIGIEADAKTQLVPVHVRLVNSDERLRSGEPVQVRFNDHFRLSGAK